MNRSLYAIGGATLALITVVAIVAGGCAGPAVAVEGTAVPATAAVPTTVVATPVTPVDAFIAAMEERGMTWEVTREVKVTFATSLCELAKTDSREQVIAKMTKREQGAAEIAVDLAKQHVCPTTPWGTGTASATTSAPSSGGWTPMVVMPFEGLYQVTMQAGTGLRVQPGQYHTDGGAEAGVGCYWAKIDPRTRETISGQSNYIHGPDTVFLNEGDWFETKGCDGWMHG